MPQVQERAGQDAAAAQAGVKKLSKKERKRKRKSKGGSCTTPPTVSAVLCHTPRAMGCRTCLVVPDPAPGGHQVL